MKGKIDTSRILLAELEEYHPYDELETQHLRNLIAFLSESPDPFGNPHEKEKGHITGSAIILNKEMNKIFLIHHAKAGRWFQPGGHSDGESNTFSVAQREAIEETGLKSLRPLSDKIFDIDIHTIPAKDERPQHSHFDLRYVFIADEDEKTHLEEGAIKGGEWVDIDNVQKYIDPTDQSVMRFINKIKPLRK